jgi:RNA polymerase sigma-70 factor (ECF subfamily)
MREAVQLAFVAALQHLPPRQRAVLLLRDVMGWAAAETAQLLDTSVTAVNSALLRARATIERRFPDGRPGALPPPDEHQHELLERYLRAWHTADVDGLVALLREDALVTMPPWPYWYAGRDAIRTFLAWVWRPMGPHRPQHRLVPAAANGQPAFAVYRLDDERGTLDAHAIQVVTIRDGAIAVLTMFRDPRLFGPFGLPAAL